MGAGLGPFTAASGDVAAQEAGRLEERNGLVRLIDGPPSGLAAEAPARSRIPPLRLVLPSVREGLTEHNDRGDAERGGGMEQHAGVADDQIRRGDRGEGLPQVEICPCHRVRGPRGNAPNEFLFPPGADDQDIAATPSERVDHRPETVRRPGLSREAGGRAHPPALPLPSHSSCPRRSSSRFKKSWGRGSGKSVAPSNSAKRSAPRPTWSQGS